MKEKIIQIVQSVLGMFGYKLVLAKQDLVMDSEFDEIFNKCKSYTMTSKRTAYALYKSVIYIVESNIEGDFVECGVWKGGSALIIAYTLLKLGIKNRKIYLYDTYKGMSKPSEEDFEIMRVSKAIHQWRQDNKTDHNKWCYASLEDVKKYMSYSGYPEDQIKYIEGKVEDTIPKILPEKIALLRLDTDWYDSTRHELTHLYPKLITLGVLIIDDYGFWAGSKKAVDEYFKGKKHILLTRIDYGSRLLLKVVS